MGNNRQRTHARTKTILIVEDDEASRKLLKDYMLALGYTSVPAENGRAALAAIKKQLPDLVLLDIMMPEMDGYEVLEHLKSDSNLRHLPVIMISALGGMESVAQCIKRGADDYLLKPFNSTLLEARISACLEKKQLRDQEQKLHEELASSYEALQKAQDARDALTHMIIHDLNNCLMRVQGFAELSLQHLREDAIDKNRLISDLTCIHDSAAEMSSLIGDILDVSRLEAGEMPVSLTALNAVELSRGTCEQFGVQAEKSGVRLSFVPESDNITVMADRGLSTRILQNLLSNALRHAGSGTNVVFSVKRHGQQVIFSVADDGPGIPEHYRERIFEKFFQAEARKEGKKYGVGIGLAFCKMAAEAQGGNIWVDSKEGEGATFHVVLAAQNT